MIPSLRKVYGVGFSSAVVAAAANLGPDGQVRFIVRDRGPGIPDYAHERVFERFYSLPRPDSGQRSSGLGLPFVREVMRLHGGEASLRNRPEGGAEAVLSLPAV